MPAGQLQALKELPALPIAHTTAFRFADKSAVTVITCLENDDCATQNTMQNSKFYNIVDKDPPESIKKKMFKKKENGPTKAFPRILCRLYNCY